ncbi:MAG: YbhB/YbcL family Raf kinase inhibitor-like protein [Myxococcales bacterium]|nr:YbhB/YbcL family Raf kinase inhibitor-like protein [Myxococcales bacterium]
MRPALLATTLVLSASACGDDGGTGNPSVDAPTGGGSADAAIDSAPPDTPMGGTFAITSPTITEGGAIPLTHVCANRGGMNQSPQLVFANPPAGTMSYAVVLTDLSNGLVHSAIYDIPSSATGLPADVDKVYAPPDVPGAHQTLAYNNMRGYAGPCPSTAHMYQFKIYALSTATLPNAMMNTTKDQVVTAAATNLGTATLTATFTP